jgi:hypothetical protein
LSDNNTIMKYWSERARTRNNSSSNGNRNLKTQHINAGQKGPYQFEGKKEDFYNFQNEMRTKFGAASVRYLLQPQQMEDILESEEEPDYENMPNGATQWEKYDLKQRNDRLRKDFEYRRGIREKKYTKMQHDVDKAISIIMDMCHEPITKQIHVLRSTSAYQERNIEDQFAHLLTYLRDKYGPDGENTVSKWGKMLEAMRGNEPCYKYLYYLCHTDGASNTRGRNRSASQRWTTT